MESFLLLLPRESKCQIFSIGKKLNNLLLSNSKYLNFQFLIVSLCTAIYLRSNYILYSVDGLDFMECFGPRYIDALTTIGLIVQNTRMLQHLKDCSGLFVCTESHFFSRVP